MALATLVLSSTLLVIVVTASNYASQLLRGEMENTEFNQGKEVLSGLNRMIERVTSASGSSGYIRSGFITTHPRFDATGKTLRVLAGGTLLKELSTTVVKIRGGRDVTGAFQNVSGTSMPLVVGISASMGWLFKNRTDAEEVVLDYSRARCVYKGFAQLYNGTGYETFNVIEVTVVSLSSGSISFRNSGAFVVQNKALESRQYQFAGNVQVEAYHGALSRVVSLTELGGNSSYKTLLNLFVVNVEVSVVQG